MGEWGWVPPPGTGYIRDPFVLIEPGRPRHRPRLLSDRYVPGQHYYQHPPSDPYADMYVPHEDPGLHRAHSIGAGRRPPRNPATPPVVINNINQEEIPIRGRPVSVAVPYYADHEDSRTRERSRHRGRDRSRAAPARSRDPSPYEWWETNAEVERMKEELEAHKRQKEREAHEQQVKNELMLQKVREEEKKRDEERQRREIEQRAVEEWSRRERERVERENREREEEEARRKQIETRAILEHERKARERAAKEKEEVEQREAEYRARLQKDFNLTEEQIDKLMKKDKSKKSGGGDGGGAGTTTTTRTTTELTTALEKRVTYTKIARKHISLETLRHFDLPYKLDDTYPEFYVLVKRWVPEELQEQLWDHTRRIRDEKAREVRRIEFEQLAAERQRQRNRGISVGGGGGGALGLGVSEEFEE
ncbi:MAG: hypothetical protein M1815_003471 [Lichina confinis]|nr:MAG: hypothetical protein M1815_003471 [Lichina confinis]